LLNDEAIVIISDCSRRNFWNTVGISNPFAPTIEWHKHQAPRQWRSLLEDSGFEFLDLRWSWINGLGPLSSNFLVQYLTFSHFVLRVKAI
jgi:hypothetical protein